MEPKTRRLGDELGENMVVSFFGEKRGTNQAVGLVTMKWLKRTAQGFSPGNRPKQARPERATDEWALFQGASDYREFGLSSGIGGAHLA